MQYCGLFPGHSELKSLSRKDLLEEAKLYGADINNFDYEAAPGRGRLEGVRDFTDKPTYRKWHNFEKDDPYGVSN